MPTWLKVILGIIIALLVVVAAAIFLGYRWFSANRGRLVQAGTAAREQGFAFARDHDAQQCIDEALTRLHASSDFTNEIRARVFLRSCLSAAPAPATFCESVPRSSEIVAAAEWTVNECRSRDAAEISRCSRVLQEVVTGCDSEHKRPAPAGQTSK